MTILFSTFAPGLVRALFDCSCRGGKWYLLVAVICISLMTNEEHLFMYLLANVYLVWRNGCSNVPIFKFGYIFIVEL